MTRRENDSGFYRESARGVVGQAISDVADVAQLLLNREQAAELFWPFSVSRHGLHPNSFSSSHWKRYMLAKARDAHRLAAVWARGLSSGANGAAEHDRFGNSAATISQGGVFGSDAIEEAEQMLDEVVGPEHLKHPAVRDLKPEPAPTRLLVVAAFMWLVVEQPILHALVEDREDRNAN
jgi:hypothetical protein